MPTHARSYPTTCQRCGDTLVSSAMSRFNTDVCCMPCLDDERLAPGYETAHAAETRAVRSGDYNYKGVGLAPADYAFLRERLEERRRSQQPAT
jgi:hypothetical protein